MSSDINESMQKAQEYAEKYSEELNDVTEEETSLEDTSVKVLQITINDLGLPNINYNNLTLAEVVGLLDMAKKTVEYETLGKVFIQKKLNNIVANI